MKITDVNVSRVNGTTKLVAVASIVLDNEFVIYGIKIVQGTNGLFIAMPSKRDLDGKFVDIAHPINSSTREVIQKAILDKYEQILKEEI